MRSSIAAIICSAALGFGASYRLHMQQETVHVALRRAPHALATPDTIWSG